MIQGINLILQKMLSVQQVSEYKMSGESIVHLETEFHCQIWRKRGNMKHMSVGDKHTSI